MSDNSLLVWVEHRDGIGTGEVLTDGLNTVKDHKQLILALSTMGRVEVGLTPFRYMPTGFDFYIYTSSEYD